MELPHTDKVADARREMNMATSRLEHAVLQTVINYTAENNIPREQIVMALINSAGYWQKKIMLAALHQRIQEEKDV